MSGAIQTSADKNSGAMAADKLPYEEEICRRFDFLLKDGFRYEYLYQKGSDCSCVYIYRFSKGKDFIDFRTVSGGKERNVVIFKNGQYFFPNFAVRYKKAIRAFSLRHFWKKASVYELWGGAATLLQTEMESDAYFPLSKKMT